jgi:hypothetical protein
MNGRGSTHTGGAVLIAAAVATPLAPIIMGWVAHAMGGDDLFGGIGLLLMVAFYAPQALLVVFLLTITAGAALSRLRIRNMVFYSVVGSSIGVIGVAVLTVTAFGGSALVFSTESGVTAAIAGAFDGAIYWIIARSISALRKPS